MSCAVKGCNNVRRFKPKGVTFHQFPNKGGRLKAWLQVLGLPEDWIWSKNKLICSNHFAKNDFIDGGTRRRLKFNAVPMVLPKPIANLQTEICPEASTSIAVDTTDTSMTDQLLRASDSSVAGSSSGKSGVASSIKAVKKHVTRKRKLISDNSKNETSSSTDTSLKIKNTDKLVATSKGEASASSTDSSIKRKRVKFIQTIHSYSISPGKIKRKYEALKGSHLKARKRLYSAKRTITSLQRRVTSLKTVIDDLRKNSSLSEDALSHLEKGFEDVPHVLMSRYIKNANNGTVTREKYPEKLRNFACTLQFYSSKAYNYVRKTFALALPHISVIRKWCANIDCNPGFCDPSFEALTIKSTMAKNKKKKIVCSLMLDEMAIRKQIEFDGKRTWGYIDCGTGIESDDLQPATEALVLMVVVLNSHWKIPIAYFFIKSLSGQEKANIVKDALSRLYKTGIIVVSLTCDGPSAHLTMLKELGCKLDNVHNMVPWFNHPSSETEKVFCLLDVCHMIKLLRNLLAALEQIRDPDGGIISWNFIKKLYEIQETETLNLANKLKKSHMEWQKQKMKVSLAAQTLSSSVADALDFLCNEMQHPDFIDVQATTSFIRRVDSLFDVLNSKSPWSKGFKAPMRITNEDKWRPFLEESISYLLRCTDVGGRPLWCTPRKTPIIGFAISALSAIGIFDEFVKKGPLDYLLTYKLSQDHLETFFCSVRSRNGWNNNPSCRQFMYTFRRLLLHSRISGSGGNCRVLDDTSVLTISSAASKDSSKKGPDFLDISVLRRYGAESLAQCPQVPQDHDYDVLPILVDLNQFSSNVVTYISGFVVRMIKKQIKCPDCMASCILNKLDGFSNLSEYAFINVKNKGGLYVPSEGVVRICTFTEESIRKIMRFTCNRLPSDSTFTENFVMAISQRFYFFSSSLFPSLKEHFEDLSSPTESHDAILIKSIVASYVRIRMFNLAKRYTATIQGSLVRKELNKLILFNHQ